MTTPFSKFMISLKNIVACWQMRSTPYIGLRKQPQHILLWSSNKLEIKYVKTISLLSVMTKSLVYVVVGKFLNLTTEEPLYSGHAL